MDWTLEVVVVPVADVARAKEFYAEKLGFHVDHDTETPDGHRFVQLTPPGSGCSIVIGTLGTTGGPPEMSPGSQRGLQLVVADLRAGHAELAGRGVEVSEVQVWDAGALRPAGEDDALDNVGFFFLEDPEGNGWVVQQISARG